MVDTLQQTLRPLHFMCFIMGLGFYLRRKQSKVQWISHLYILYSLIIWFAYTCSFLYMIYFKRKVLFESAATEIIEDSNLLLSITSVIMSFYHQKRFEISIKKLAIVDNTLEKLGSPKMYKKLQIKLKQIIIGWIVYSLTINFFDTMWWMKQLEETASWGLFLAQLINYCIHVNTFMDILFIVFLWYIGTRFDKVNEHIQYLLVTEDHELIMRCTLKRSVITLHQYTLNIDYKYTLWTSMHLHLELCHIARELNFIFTVQMTFKMTFYFLSLTSQFYYLYWMLMQEHREEIFSIYDWFSISLWIFIFLVKLYVVNYICDYVIEKANKTGKLFHQLTYIHRYADVWKEIYQFNLQTMQHPLKFTGMDLFDFGHEFIRKFCMAIVIYVIIMEQFKIVIVY